MKQFAMNALAFIFLFSLYSYVGKVDSKLNAKEIEKIFVQLNETIFFGKYEVSNSDYKKFMAYLKNTKGEDLYQKCLLDTAQWETRPNNASSKDTYHSLKAFDNYPVVTVSYEAANEYCKWLTEQYNSDGSRKFKKVIFRLPTEQEWTEAASGGNKNKMYPWDNFYLRNKKGGYLCNFLHLGDQSIYYDAKTNSYKVAEQFVGYTARAVVFDEINAFSPSPAGLYNLSGNAAEMVAEKGLAKGGSYNDPGYDVRISSKKYYDSPSTEVGFRVLMEVVEK